MRIVRVFNAHPKYRRRHRETILLVQRVLKGEKRSNAEINVIFADDKTMLQLNKTYLRHPYPTDVISFSLADETQRLVVGDVYIGVNQAVRQAKEYRVSLRNELARLAVHGVLHLIGYDDRLTRQRLQMTSLENRYLQFL